MEVINACNDNIDVVHVGEDIFINWDKLEDKFFKIMPPNTTKENYIFEVNDGKPKNHVSEFYGEN